MASNLQHMFDLVVVLVQKEMKVRYKNSFLGYVWSVGNPLAFAFVFFIAFKVVIRIRIEDYVLFLIAGLFPWQWFSNSVNASPMIYLGNASLIKKVSLPRNLIPLSLVLNDMIHFILTIPVISLLMLLHHKAPSFSWFYLIPLMLVIQFLLTYGLCLAISSVNLFFRDMERLVIICVTFLFYFTPVIFSEAMVPDRYRILLKVNPLASLMINWRNVFLKGTLDLNAFLVSSGYAVLLFGLGFFIYRKLSPRFAETL